jgi:hypothetical protein
MRSDFGGPFSSIDTITTGFSLTLKSYYAQWAAALLQPLLSGPVLFSVPLPFEYLNRREWKPLWKKRFRKRRMIFFPSFLKQDIHEPLH